MANLNSVIYCSGEMGPPTISEHISDVQGSGVTTVVLWAMHIGRPSIAGQHWGDLIYNNSPYTLVSQGTYNSDYAAYPGQVAQLKQNSDVTKIFFSIGGANPPVWDFTSIATIISESGTGTNSPLYQNFSALRSAFTTNGVCAIDGIDLDCEEDVSTDTIVQFSEMLFGLGFEVTFCPYANATNFWQPSMQSLWNAGYKVSWWNLQCYSGGYGNRYELPNWISAIAGVTGEDAAPSYLVPGLAVSGSEGDGQCPTGSGSIESTFAGWKSLGIPGGFLWNYGSILNNEGSGSCSGSANLAAYVQAIDDGLSG